MRVWLGGRNSKPSPVLIDRNTVTSLIDWGFGSELSETRMQQVSNESETYSTVITVWLHPAACGGLEFTAMFHCCGLCALPRAGSAQKHQ
jgi:hypothetical protein